MRLTLLALATALALAGCQAGEPTDAAATAAPEVAPVAMPADPAMDGAAESAAEQGAPMVHGGLMMADAWTRPLAPGATVAAGYGALMNHTTQADTLVGARADGVGRIEIHTMSDVDGVMQMRPLEGGVALAVDGAASLAPGANHLMFMDVTRTWAEGETVPVTLMFESGAEVPVEFMVKQEGPDGAAGEPHSH